MTEDSLQRRESNEKAGYSKALQRRDSNSID